MSNERSFFEKQRDALLADIAVNMENVLANMNTLNRSLENVISVGKEFETVGDLWSKFHSDVAVEQVENQHPSQDRPESS